MLAIVERWRVRRRVAALLREAAEEGHLAAEDWYFARHPGALTRRASRSRGVLGGLAGALLELTDGWQRSRSMESVLQRRARDRELKAANLRAQAAGLLRTIERRE